MLAGANHLLKYEIVPAEMAHVEPIARRCRQADIDELWATAAVLPAQAIEMGLRDSVYSRTWLIDGEPAVIGGIREVAQGGILWLVTTDLMERHQRAFLIESRKEIEWAKANYNMLWNYIDARNLKAVRWLKWTGFEIGEAVSYGIFKKPFYPFWYWRERMVA